MQIAEMLLRAGAEPDATCDGYGASIDGLVGQACPPIATAVAFGSPAAAEALARRGALVDVVVASGLGRLPLVERLAGEAPERVDRSEPDRRCRPRSRRTP